LYYEDPALITILAFWIDNNLLTYYPTVAHPLFNRDDFGGVVPPMANWHQYLESCFWTDFHLGFCQGGKPDAFYKRTHPNAIRDKVADFTKDGSVLFRDRHYLKYIGFINAWMERKNMLHDYDLTRGAGPCLPSWWPDSKSVAVELAERDSLGNEEEGTDVTPLPLKFSRLLEDDEPSTSSSMAYATLE
jgi:hypothetical protein